MTKIKWMITLVALLMLTGILASILYVNYLTRNIDCIGNLSIYNKGDRLSLLIGRKMSDGKGIDSITGTLYENNVSVGWVERTVRFTYHEDQGKYIMTSQSVLKGVHDNITDKQITGYISTMYARKGENNILILKSIGRSGWMVYVNPVPLYICTRNS